MPKYRVLEKSFIENQLREAGEVVDYDHPADAVIGANLERVGKKAKVGLPEGEPDGATDLA